MKFKLMLSVLTSLTLLTNVSTAFASGTASSQNRRLIWSDEFDGNTINRANWTFDIGTGNNGWGNNELQYYTNRNENARVEDGNLIIEAKKESYNNSNYTSARLKTKNLKQFTYGRIEARMKLPQGQGIWPAFWMLGSSFNGDSDWPQCGEIDIMEHLNNEKLIHGTLHIKQNNYPKTLGSSTPLNSPEDYHVYAIEWNSSYIKWFVDDTLYYQVPLGGQIKINNNCYYVPNNAIKNEALNKPFFILLNVAVGGNWPKYPDNTTQFPAKMYVDYVRVYSNN